MLREKGSSGGYAFSHSRFGRPYSSGRRCHCGGRVSRLDYSRYDQAWCSIVDVGINETDDGIVGDVDFDAVKEVTRLYHLVPGGVGSVTTVLLFKNLLKGLKMQQA